jgi:hypothetical protein
MKDPKKQTQEQKARKERKNLRRIKEAIENKMTWHKRGRYAKRLAKFGHSHIAQETLAGVVR